MSLADARGEAAAAPPPVDVAGVRSAAFDQVRRAVRAMLRRLALPAGGLVLSAVSGGADSLALTAAVVAEAERAGLRVGAVTVDHGLQDGSAQRADEVARLCSRLGADPVAVERAAVDTGSGAGLEAAARHARYCAIDAAADRLGAAAVLLGHTLDDQAETVLLGLARGSGARSLSGMPAVRGRFARPLIGVRRAVTSAACRDLALPVWNDPHNGDPSFARVRARQHALPALESALGPGIAEALARSADLLRDDADALDASAEAALDRMTRNRPGGSADAGLAISELHRLPAAVRRRVIRRAAEASGVPSGRLTAAQLREVERLVVAWHGQGGVRLPGGIDALRRSGGACDTLVFR